MITLLAPFPLLTDLRRSLLDSTVESAAIFLCVPVPLRSIDSWRLIVREVHIPPDHAYEERTAVSARLKPEFGLPIEKKAKQNGWSLVYAHTHPHQHSQLAFSSIDDNAEIALARYAEQRSPQKPHIALLIGPENIRARRLGGDEPVRIVEVGSERYDIVSNLTQQNEDESQFNRQVLAFGEKGQSILRELTIAIVGLGGTGSHIAQQLAYLGVTNFCLIDRDSIEASNLNRTVGATRQDVGTPKVKVAERLIKTIQSKAKIETVADDIVNAGIGRRVAECDIIFCCTDSHASRHLLNQLAYQYLVPTIDLGVSLTLSEHAPLKIGGHVKALVPGQACLWCVGNLDPHQVREETMSSEQRAAVPYFGSGSGVAQPAVISINGTMASMAVTMFLSMVTGIPTTPRYLIYDGNRGRINGATASPDTSCNFCSPDTTVFGGDAFPLPERRRV